MLLSESHKKRLQELAGVVSEKDGTPRTLAHTSKRSAKYRNPEGPSKYFSSYKNKEKSKRKKEKELGENENLEEISINAIELPKNYIHDHLNQEIWIGETLRPEIQNKLEEIAKDFHEYIEVDVPVKDIWLTGSLANYNWTDYSDVDLHVLIDYNKIEGDNEFVRNYLGGKKTIWNDRHDIKMKEFDVELYAQDENESHRSTGVYSIQNEIWIRKPSLERPEIDRESVKEKIKSLADRIEEIEKIEDSEKTIKKGEKLKEKIKNMRQSGLEKVGEFSVENLAFKYLRNNGYIERLFDAIRSSYDKSVSITEQESSATFEYNEKKNLVLSNEVLNDVKNIHGNQVDFNERDLAQRILKFPYYELTEVPMSTLNINEFQSDESIIDDYVEKTRVNPDYPPIVFDSETNNIIDGMYRAKALKKLGHDTVRAFVGVKELKSMNESIRKIIRNNLNEFFNSKGFHASMDDWLEKWRKKGIEVDKESYGDGMDMGFSKRGNIFSENEIFSKSIETAGPTEYDYREIEIGAKVELEHTDNKNEAIKIALKHLEENGTYYTEMMDCGLINEPKAVEVYNKYFGDKVVTEAFKSKAQQRYFYAMADKPGKKGKKFKKWANEFSDDTNFKNLPEKVTEEEEMENSKKSHQMFLEKNLKDEHENNADTIKNFIKFCCNHAEIDEYTIVYLRGTRDDKLRTTASYNPDNHNIHIYSKGRHVVDVLRSIAHELMHMKQELENRLYDNSGEDGSSEENEAHAFSGLMIRKFGREKPKIYEGYKFNKNLI